MESTRDSSCVFFNEHFPMIGISLGRKRDCMSLPALALSSGWYGGIVCLSKHDHWLLRSYAAVGRSSPWVWLLCTRPHQTFLLAVSLYCRGEHLRPPQTASTVCAVLLHLNCCCQTTSLGDGEQEVGGRHQAWFLCSSLPFDKHFIQHTVWRGEDEETSLFI